MKQLKKKIVNMIVNFLSKIIDEINQRKNHRTWSFLEKEFKCIGENVYIQAPFLISNPQCISIGDNFRAREHLRLEAITEYSGGKFYPNIIIQNNVSMEFNCHIGAVNHIEIHDNVLIASNVYIADHMHGRNDYSDITRPPVERELSFKGKMVIEKNVWIGDSVCILPGVSIGENTIVGANSVVTKSFPSNVIIAGVPAKIIKRIDE